MLFRFLSYSGAMSTQIRTTVLAFLAATLTLAQAFGLDLTPEQLAATGAWLASTYGVVDVAVRARASKSPGS